MSNPLALREEDVKLMLAAKVYVGTKNCDPNMRRYVWRRKQKDGIHVIHLGKTWEKLMLAARVIVAIENPEDVVVVSSRTFGQRAVFKFGQHTGAQCVGGRYTPGMFTNQIQRRFTEPRILVATDPMTDNQPILESSYSNIPVISFCNTDANVKHVDIAIPCNNQSKHSIALMYWMLAREVLRMRNTISRNEPWGIMVDLFMYREPEESEKTDEPVAALAAADATLLSEEPASQAVNSFNLGPKVAEWGADDAAPTMGGAGYAAAQQNWQAGTAAPAEAAQGANWNAAAPATTASTGWDTNYTAQ